MHAKNLCALVAILISTQAFSLTAETRNHGCNPEAGDCANQDLGGGGGSPNITINDTYGNMDDRYWIAADGESAGFGDWTTFAKQGSQEAGGKHKKIPKGKKPDFSGLPLVQGFTPQVFKDLLAQDKKNKAGQQAAADKAAKQAAEAKAAAEAANKAAAVYTGPAISSKPAGGGVVAGARTKP